MARRVHGRGAVVQDFPRAGGIERRDIQGGVIHDADQKVSAIRKKPGRRERLCPGFHGSVSRAVAVPPVSATR